MTTLTPPQELFARRVAEGKNQSDAYREAYPKSQKWKLTSVTGMENKPEAARLSA